MRPTGGQLDFVLGVLLAGMVSRVASSGTAEMAFDLGAATTVSAGTASADSESCGTAARTTMTGVAGAMRQIVLAETETEQILPVVGHAETEL